MATLITQTLNTLSDTVIGPNEMNQALLIDNKYLLDFINQLIAIDITIDTSPTGILAAHGPNRSVKIRLIYEGVKFLNSMIAGNNDKTKLERLLNQIDVTGLGILMSRIYSIVIKQNKDNLYWDRKCILITEAANVDLIKNSQNTNQKFDDAQEDTLRAAKEETNFFGGKKQGKKIRDIQCTEDCCLEGYLNHYDLLLVDTGFYIFLIFQQFEDMLPDHQKIKSMKKINIDTKEYDRLQGKMEKECWLDTSKDYHTESEVNDL